MKNYLHNYRKLTYLLIFLIPFLMGSSNQVENNNNRFSLFNYTVFTPGSDVTINLYSASKSDNYFRFRLFKIDDPASYFSKIDRNSIRNNFDMWGRDRDFLLKYTKLVKEWNAQINSSNNYWSSKNLEVGKINNPGTYILQALKDDQVAYCGIVISNMAMVYKNSGKQLLAFVANSQTGQIVKDVKFSLYNEGKLLHEKETDAEGLALFNIAGSVKAENKNMLLLGKTSKETVLSDPYFYFREEDKNYTAYIYTNQPVYRPGQEVYFKAILREKNGNNFENVPGEQFTIKIKAPKNKDVYSAELKTNGSGSLSGNFNLDNNADLGRYNIQVTKNEMTYFGSFDVEEYKKPECFVKVETDRNQYAGNDTITAMVSADYYFGSPVTNAKVSIKVYRQQYWRPWWYWSEYSWFYKSFNNNRFGFGNKELITEQIGALDKNGKFKYQLKAPASQDADYTYTISAEVTDNSRSTITGGTDVYVTRGSFTLSTSPDRYFVEEGRPVDLRINASDFNNKPVQTDFKVVINYPAEKSKHANGYHPVSDTLAGKTDTLGKAVVTYIPRVLLSGYYKYVVYTKDEKGRSITTQSSFFVGRGNDYYYGRTDYGLEIVPDKDSYNKGDSLTAYIFFPQNNIDVLISYESKDFLGYKVYHVDNNSLTVKLKLTDEYAPSFNIDVTYLNGGQLNQTSKLIGVLDREKFLNITLKPSKEIYKPGEKVKYDISVKDYKGRPVKDADLSLGVVDESIYAIKEDETPDIKSFFYAPQYSYIPTYTSLQNNNFNGTSRLTTILDSKNQYKNISPEGNGNVSGKLITKKGQVNFKSIYVLLSGENYYYQTKVDSAGKYKFTNIKTGEYSLIALLDDGELISPGKIEVKEKTNGDINLSNYSNIFSSAPGIMRFAGSRIFKENAATQIVANGKMEAAVSAAEDTFVEPEIRNKFADAAFWNPDVITDENGNAEVSFKLPDNLTTWRATVRGITKNTYVGQEVSKIISRKNLLIRLETPRFFREGDELLITTIVHNYLKSKKEVKINFNPGILTLVSSRINQPGYSDKWNGKEQETYKIPVDKNSEVRIDWKVKVNEPIGTAVLKASALTNEESDAVELKIPVWPEGIKTTEPVTADYSNENGKKVFDFYIPKDVDLRTAAFTFSAAPSLAGTMLKALDDLVGYPYGCVEQTMSRFLPSIIVANTFKELNAPLKSATIQELPKVVKAGLKRLYNFQHSDGGWGWWTNDKTNPYMTAYVIYGMTLARDDGYAIDSAVYSEGLTNLKNQISEDGQVDFTTRAYMIYALTTAVKVDSNKNIYNAKIENLLKQNLNSYALSLLALSLNNLGNKIQTDKVLKRLINSAQRQNKYVYWGGKAWHYSWQDDKVQSTAFVVKALLLQDNNNQLIADAVRWLLLQKQGFSWHSTQETSTVLFSLTDYLKRTNELSPDFNVEIYLNNKKVLDKNFSQSDVFESQPSIKISEIPDKVLQHGNNKIVIVKRGKGTIYFSGVNEFYLKKQETGKNKLSFNVTREYYLLKPENRGDKIIYIKHKVDSPIKSGDVVLVTTQVKTKEKDLQYFLLEDMLPSGFEVVKDETKYEIEGDNEHPNNYIGLRPWPGFYADKEYRDDRVSFFVTYANEEMNFSYIIRAELPGNYYVAPARGYLMYYPEVSGNSKVFNLKVDE